MMATTIVLYFSTAHDFTIENVYIFPLATLLWFKLQAMILGPSLCYRLKMVLYKKRKLYEEQD